MELNEKDFTVVIQFQSLCDLYQITGSDLWIAQQ